MSSKDGKQYGLILPKSKQSSSTQVQAQKATAKPSVFGEDSSSDDDTSTDWMKKKLQASNKFDSTSAGHSGGMKKQAKMKVAAALAEDPTVYQYDEVYDQIEAKKQEEQSVKNADKVSKKPRYIQQMMKNAERQKRENERRIERQVQKDREAEGEQFADKEKFVTSAYRKKMEENAKLDEEEDRMDRIEKALDVKGQKDMSGFYRHLYRQTMGEEKGQNTKEEITVENSEEKMEIKKTSANKREYRKRDAGNFTESDEESNSESSSTDSESSGDGTKNNDKEITEEISEKDIEKQRMEKEETRREKLRKDKDKRERRKRRIEQGQDTSSDESDKENSKSNDDERKLTDNESSKQPEKSSVLDISKDIKSIKKPKIDIWKKITVGDVFEAALERYLIRKQSRTSSWP